MNSRDAAYDELLKSLGAKSENDPEDTAMDNEVIGPRRKRKRLTDVGVDSNE